METSSPTQEVGKAISSTANVQDREDHTERSDVVDAPVSSVDNTEPNHPPDSGCISVEKTVEKPDVPVAETEPMPVKTLSLSDSKDHSDPVETKDTNAFSGEPMVHSDTSSPEQLHNPPEVKSAPEKETEPMETGETSQPTTEVVNRASNNETGDQQICAVIAEAIPQESQQLDGTTAIGDTESGTLAESIGNAETEIIDISKPSPEPQSESTKAVASGNPGSLSLLAEMYDSGNDSDVCEVPSMQNYQNRVVEIDSDTESSSSSSSEEDNEPIDVDALNAAIADDDEEEAVRSSRSPRVKGEFHLDDLPPIHELQITVPEEECTELGKIQSIVDQLVIVNSLPGTVPLDLDTVLFLDKGKKVLGEVFDVLGQVSDPLYCIRFNSNKDIKSKGIEVGQTVYVAPRTEHTQFVILANLMKERGSDASWEYDIEPPERYLDYSDDEEERSARRTIRNKNRPVEAGVEGPKRHRPADATPHSGQRPYRGSHHGGPRMQHFPDNYRIAGSSWHSNYPSNYSSPHQQYNQYRPPPRFYRPPVHGMPVRPPAHGMPVRPPAHDMPIGPPAHSGMVVNPYAVFPPPHLMQQPLFPPPTHQPPPPAPQGPHGGY